MATIKQLEGTLHSLNKLRSALSEICSARQLSPLYPKAPQLELPKPSTEALRSSLVHLNVNEKTTRSLLSIFEATFIRFANALEHENAKAVEALVRCDGGTEVYQLKTQARLLQVFNNAVQRMQADIISVVVDNREKICRDLENNDIEAPVSQGSAIDDQDPSNRRGHDSTAVKILERAYAHTPNITQAEKYKLAEATGLQPRQVTIWFQNQRNRKSKKQGKAQAELKLEAASGATGKRKPVYGHYLGLGAPADVSDVESAASSCASKKRRTSRLASDESNASTGTLDSFDSLHDWSVSSSSGSSLSGDSFGKEETDANTLGNVFHRLCLPHEVDHPMPDVTVSTSPLEPSSLSRAFRFPDSPSLFSDQQGWHDFVFDPKSGHAQLDFADLQLDEGALNRALQQGLDNAFSTPARHASSAVFTTPDNDEDEWMDEEDFSRAPRKVQPHGRVVSHDDTPTHVRAPVHWDQTPRGTHQPLHAATLTSPDGLSDADAHFINSLLSLPSDGSACGLATGADGQPCLDLEIDLAELDVFFQHNPPPAAQYVFNFDRASSDVLLPVPRQ